MKYRLKEICIEVTNECPSNCMHCSSEAGKALPNELTLDEIKSIIDDFKEMNTPAIDRDKSLSLEEAVILFAKINSLSDEEKKLLINDREYIKRKIFELREANNEKPTVELSGGEPLVKKDIIEVIRYIKEKGFRVVIYTSGLINSNNRPVGITSDQELIDNLFRLLVREDGDCMIFSLEGAKERTHDGITNRNGHYKIIMDAMQAFLQIKMNVEIHCTPMRLNYREIPDLISIGNEFKIQNISFLRLVPQGRALQYIDALMLDQKEFKELIEILHKEWLNAEESQTTKIRLGCPIDFRHLIFPIKRKPCHGGKDQLLIRPNGDIHPCPAWKEIENMSLGNIRDEKKEKPIKDAWINSEVINLFRSYSADGLWGDCYFCIHGTDICGGGCPAQRIISNKTRGIQNKEAQLRVGPDPLCFKHLL